MINENSLNTESVFSRFTDSLETYAVSSVADSFGKSMMESNYEPVSARDDLEVNKIDENREELQIPVIKILHGNLQGAFPKLHTYREPMPQVPEPKVYKVFPDPAFDVQMTVPKKAPVIQLPIDRVSNKLASTSIADDSSVRDDLNVVTHKSGKTTIASEPFNNPTNDGHTKIESRQDDKTAQSHIDAAHSIMSLDSHSFIEDKSVQTQINHKYSTKSVQSQKSDGDFSTNSFPIAYDTDPISTKSSCGNANTNELQTPLKKSTSAFTDKCISTKSNSYVDFSQSVSFHQSQHSFNESLYTPINCVKPTTSSVRFKSQLNHNYSSGHGQATSNVAISQLISLHETERISKNQLVKFKTICSICKHNSGVTFCFDCRKVFCQICWDQVSSYQLQHFPENIIVSEPNFIKDSSSSEYIQQTSHTDYFNEINTVNNVEEMSLKFIPSQPENDATESEPEPERVKLKNENTTSINTLRQQDSRNDSAVKYDTADNQSIHSDSDSYNEGTVEATESLNNVSYLSDEGVFSTTLRDAGSTSLRGHRLSIFDNTNNIITDSTRATSLSIVSINNTEKCLQLNKTKQMFVYTSKDTPTVNDGISKSISMKGLISNPNATSQNLNNTEFSQPYVSESKNATHGTSTPSGTSRLHSGFASKLSPRRRLSISKTPSSPIQKMKDEKHICNCLHERIIEDLLLTEQIHDRSKSPYRDGKAGHLSCQNKDNRSPNSGNTNSVVYIRPVPRELSQNTDVVVNTAIPVSLSDAIVNQADHWPIPSSSSSSHPAYISSSESDIIGEDSPSSYEFSCGTHHVKTALMNNPAPAHSVLGRQKLRPIYRQHAGIVKTPFLRTVKNQSYAEQPTITISSLNMKSTSHSLSTFGDMHYATKGNDNSFDDVQHKKYVKIKRNMINMKLNKNKHTVFPFEKDKESFLPYSTPTSTSDDNSNNNDLVRDVSLNATTVPSPLQKGSAITNTVLSTALDKRKKLPVKLINILPADLAHAKTETYH